MANAAAFAPAGQTDHYRRPLFIRSTEIALADLASSSPPDSNETSADVPPRRPVYQGAKRIFDLLASAVGLLVASPLLALAALAVRLDSPGPVLFVQQRVGRNFRPFGIYKFRTMVADADRRGGPITFGADPRVTRVGRWLRRSKIDELPQLVNVLLGHMSLVGPRPEVPKYVDMFRDDYTYVLSVRPGLTDPASMKYRDEAEQLAASPDPGREYAERILPDKIALARQYIAGATFAGDVGILLKTLLRIAR
jgi:lipopolysaccharide/colanic/teichoic acid biosynthesis glycosyltransferase